MSKIRTKIKKDEDTHYTGLMRKRSGNPMEGRTLKPPPPTSKADKERKGTATTKLVQKTGHYPKRVK
jgi:hypothetical protein